MYHRNCECRMLPMDNNCIQWVKRLMSMPRRWCNRPRFGLTLTVIFLCKIRAPRLLVIVRVFCLFHTAPKCTQTYHFGPTRFSLGRNNLPAPHRTPISVYSASPPYWNPKYATDWICQTSTKWSNKVCVSTCCAQGHNSPQIHNIQQQAVQHTTIHTESNKCVSKMLTCHTGTAKPMYSTTTPFTRPTFTVMTAI